MWLFQWIMHNWGQTPIWLRFGLPVLILGGSFAMTMAGIIWIWGYIIGVIMMVIALISTMD